MQTLEWSFPQASKQTKKKHGRLLHFRLKTLVIQLSFHIYPLDQCEKEDHPPCILVNLFFFNASLSLDIISIRDHSAHTHTKPNLNTSQFGTHYLSRRQKKISKKKNGKKFEQINLLLSFIQL